MRFEVPQFIEVEAKVIGPFTWKQFVYLGGGVGLLVILFLTLPFILFVILGLPVGILSGTLAFQKINNRPLSLFLEAMFNFLIRKKMYLWRRSEPQQIIERTAHIPDKSSNVPYVGQKTVQSLARTLETHQNNSAEE